MKWLVFTLLLLSGSAAFSQTSTFETGDEGWTANGDPTSTYPDWDPAGGNPGGYIRVTDASTGGTWYFVAPATFTGQKCDAYGRFLRYDQLTSDTSDQQQYGGKPDVILTGGGLQLIFDNAINPGLNWTHYDLLLRENAGWRLNSLTGPIPSPAQFKAVLANVTGLRIRGEYRAQADQGSLDNVVLESNFRFDLDGDDSSGATQADFRADTSCTANGLLTDLDAVLQSELQIDSVVISILSPDTTEELRMDALVGNVLVQHPMPGRIVLLNDGSTLPADFLLSLQLIDYFDHALSPYGGTRRIEVRIYTACGQAGLATAFLPIYPPPNAGQDADTLLCANSGAIDLQQLLGPAAGSGGYWLPALPGGNGTFHPAQDKAGTYRYLLPGAASCPGDTASVTVAIERLPGLRNDTTLCYGDTLQLVAPQDLISWQWSPGGMQRSLIVEAPGIYRLEGHGLHCLFRDSVALQFYTCRPCPFYAPNVFSPNDDGENDTWSIQLPCMPLSYHLQVFDRWGSLVFDTDDPQAAWDGRSRGKETVPGVFFWQLEWVGELLGARQIFREKGDVAVLR